MPNVEYDLCRAGDVAFFWFGSASSKVNRTAQTFERRAKARYSHVALCDGSGGFLHADIGTGVSQLYFDELVPPDFAGYSAFRHQALSQKINDDLGGFFAASSYFLGQNYIREIEERKFIRGAKKFRGKDLDIGETYCSKVVNDVFQKFASEFALPDEKPLPIDLQNMVEGAGWFEVTDGHKIYFDYLKADPSMKETWQAVKRSVQWVREGAQEQDAMADLVVQLQSVGAILERAHGVRHPVMDIELKVDEGPISFWDQRHGRKSDGEAES